MIKLEKGGKRQSLVPFSAIIFPLNNNTNSKAALAMAFGNFDTKQDKISYSS